MASIGSSAIGSCLGLLVDGVSVSFAKEDGVVCGMVCVWGAKLWCWVERKGIGYAYHCIARGRDRYEGSCSLRRAGGGKAALLFVLVVMGFAMRSAIELGGLRFE